MFTVWAPASSTATKLHAALQAGLDEAQESLSANSECGVIGGLEPFAKNAEKLRSLMLVMRDRFPAQPLLGPSVKLAAAEWADHAARVWPDSTSTRRVNNAEIARTTGCQTEN